MDGMIDIAKSRELVGNAVLWPCVRDFLWDFAPQVHESWLEGSFDLKNAAGAKNAPRIKRYILDSLGVKSCFHDFPKEDGSRILLLDGATLLEIAKWLGALACAEDLRKVTDGATVKELKASLPGVYPAVFGYTEYFRKLKVDKSKVESLTAQSIIEIGVECLFSFVANLPDALLSRLSLKLPRNLKPSTIQPSTLQFSTLQLLLKLRFPEAYRLCCS